MEALGLNVLVRILIIGCGYIGTPLGAALRGGGHEVTGTRRGGDVQGDLARAGIKPVKLDVTDADAVRRLPGEFDWIVNCAASKGGGVPDYERLYFEGTLNLLKRFESSLPGKFVFTSSTSVYGQNDGSEVTESSATKPMAGTAKVLARTEQLLLESSARGFPAIILRLAGIYGPGRGYWLRQFQANSGEAGWEADRWVNMIHRDDVVTAIMAALECGRGGEIYNVADDEPATPRTIGEWLAKMLKRPIPQSRTEFRTERKRGTSSKRVSNSKMKSQLGCRLKYPTFREGFATELGSS